MRHLALLLVLPLFGCPPERSSGAPPVDDDDATTDDDDAPAGTGCWFDGPGSDVPFAWGRRGDVVVLLAPDGGETVLHEGAGAMQNWTLQQAGDWMAVHGSWWNDGDDRGTVTALFDRGELVADVLTEGITGWEAYLSEEDGVVFPGPVDASGAATTRWLSPDGQLQDLPFGRPAGPPQLGAIPVCQDDVCGWLLDAEGGLFGALPSSRPFWPAVPYLVRYDPADPALPALRAESPWFPIMTFLQDELGPASADAAIVASAPMGRAILGQYAGWEAATWLVVDVPGGGAFELDLDGRGEAVDGGICGASPPHLASDGSLVYPIRDDATARFVRRDPASGEEAALGEPVTGFLFADARLRDGTWALSTGDGTDTFCGTSQRAWAPAPDALAGNTVQLLRPEDGIAWTLPAPPLASGYGFAVGIARGGGCASVPESADWNAPPATFDLSSGVVAPFPDGFEFGGWLD
jgi:hypothetical protein